MKKKFKPKPKLDFHTVIKFYKFHILYHWDKLNQYFNIETPDNTL